MFDIVIPCYNYGRYLRACVESVVSQTDIAFRALIIDDCSTDDSAAIGQSLAAEFPNVAFRRHEQNQGHIKTFNEGVMDWAAAPYVLLLSADDRLTPGALRRAQEAFDAHRNAAFVYGFALIEGPAGAPEWRPKAEAPLTRRISGAEFLRFNCLYGNPCPSPSVIVRGEFQRRAGRYSANMRHTSDMEMWMRLALLGDVAMIEAPQAYYRQHGANMSIAYLTGFLTDLEHRLATCEQVYARRAEAHNGAFAQWDDFTLWLGEGRRHMARLAQFWAEEAEAGRAPPGEAAACRAFAGRLAPRLAGPVAQTASRTRSALKRLAALTGLRPQKVPQGPGGTLFGRRIEL